MNPILAKSLVLLIPACILLVGSVLVVIRVRAVFSFLQLLGAGGLAVVGASHLCEALHLFPWMNWGLESSVGHYLDLSGAVLGFTLFPLGYLLQALTKQQVLRQMNGSVSAGNDVRLHS
jgi:hypothetical protein